MDDAVPLFTQWAHYFLTWVGFGTLIGLLAKMILPGKDPGGALATVVIGVFGSIVGASTLFFFAGVRISPISVMGFGVGLVATTLLLVFYRLLYRQQWAATMNLWNWRQPASRRRAPRAPRASILDE